MSENEREPRVSGVDSTVTVSGQVRDIEGEWDAENVAKQYIRDEFDGGDGEFSVGYIDIVVSRISHSDRCKFIATFELEQTGGSTKVSL